MNLYNSHPDLQRIRRRLERLYGANADACLLRLIMTAGRYGITSDRRPSPRPRWTQADALLIAYGNMVQNPSERPLVVLKRFLDQHLKHDFTWMHLLPFFPYSSDDGFAVVHYRNVNPELGTWADIQALGEHFLPVFDLVLNHVSAKSGWFSDYLAGVAPGRHYFIEADPNSNWSAVVRPRCGAPFAPFITRAGVRHVWTTFSADQIDLNYAQPDVLFEILDLLLYYIAMGARMIRLDAIAYLWKGPGTSCIHLPETHEIIRLFRDWLALTAPDVMLLTETNVPQAENFSYFGAGDEAHLVYQFSLPPLLLHSLLAGNTAALTQWAGALPEPPPGCTFLNFTASHDGIGVRPLEGMLAQADIRRLCAIVRQQGGYVSERTNADGSSSPYELNISWFDALTGTGPYAGLEHVQRYLCSQWIALALKGVPAVYLNNLVATPNDTAGVERTQQPRAINRRKWMEKDLLEQMNDPTNAAARVFHEYRRVLRLRAQHPAFHPEGGQRILDCGQSCFVLERTAPDESESILCVSNCTARHLELNRVSLPPWSDSLRDILHGHRVYKHASVNLAPYQTVWLTEVSPH
ncbi:MAG: sugar phosphorylase [Kiritimatiellae bacterium]|nr:sugar phosphorylase [Kiritimatiellia bacterium]